MLHSPLEALPESDAVRSRMGLTPAAAVTGPARQAPASGALEHDDDFLSLEEFEPVSIPELLAYGMPEVAYVLVRLCDNNPAMQTLLRQSGALDVLAQLLNVAEATVVGTAAVAIAHLISGDIHSKRVLMAAGGMLALSEVLFRSDTAEGGVSEAAHILRALADACSPATIQRCAIQLPNAAAERALLTVQPLLGFMTGLPTGPPRGGPATSKCAATHQLDRMMQESHAVRARVRAAEELAFQRVQAVIHRWDPVVASMKEKAAWALFQLCAGSVECRRALGSLQEHICSLGVHLKLADAPYLSQYSHSHNGDASDITAEDVYDWVNTSFQRVFRTAIW